MIDNNINDDDVDDDDDDFYIDTDAFLVNMYYNQFLIFVGFFLAHNNKLIINRVDIYRGVRAKKV